METFSMSSKEVPRAGLLRAALAGRLTNAQGARALRLSVRQFRRLKRRYQWPALPAPSRRLPAEGLFEELPDRLAGVDGALDDRATDAHDQVRDARAEFTVPDRPGTFGHLAGCFVHLRLVGGRG